MTDAPVGAPSRGADRFDAAEALLRRYPDLDEAELASLKRWFRKEASAFEVATLAGKESVREPYVRFRAEPMDRFSWGDIIVALGLLGVVAGVLAVIAVLAP